MTKTGNVRGVIADAYWKEASAKADQAEKDLRASLETEFSMTGHPKAEKLWKLAWDYGHAYGDNDIRGYYIDLVELVQ